MSRTRELLSSLMSAQAGGFLARSPGLDGDPGLGIAGVSGVARGKTWDAVASAHCPDLTGDAVAFVVLGDGTILVEEDVPDDSLAPLADAIEKALHAPYRAAAVRSGGDVWSIVAEKVEIVEVLGLEGDVVDLNVVVGERELSVDAEHTIRPVPALDALAESYGDVALHAERVDGDLFAVDVFPL